MTHVAAAHAHKIVSNNILVLMLKLHYARKDFKRANGDSLLYLKTVKSISGPWAKVSPNIDRKDECKLGNVSVNKEPLDIGFANVQRDGKCIHTLSCGDQQRM